MVGGSLERRRQHNEGIKEIVMVKHCSQQLSRTTKRSESSAISRFLPLIHTSTVEKTNAYILNPLSNFRRLEGKHKKGVLKISRSLTFCQ